MKVSLSIAYLWAVSYAIANVMQSSTGHYETKVHPKINYENKNDSNENKNKESYSSDKEYATQSKIVGYKVDSGKKDDPDEESSRSYNSNVHDSIKSDIGYLGTRSTKVGTSTDKENPEKKDKKPKNQSVRNKASKSQSSDQNKEGTKNKNKKGSDTNKGQYKKSKTDSENRKNRELNPQMRGNSPGNIPYPGTMISNGYPQNMYYPNNDQSGYYPNNNGNFGLPYSYQNYPSPYGSSPYQFYPNLMNPNIMPPTGMNPNIMPPTGMNPNIMPPTGMNPNIMPPTGMVSNIMPPTGMVSNIIPTSGMAPNQIIANSMNQNSMDPNPKNPENMSPNTISSNGSNQEDIFDIRKNGLFSYLVKSMASNSTNPNEKDSADEKRPKKTKYKDQSSFLEAINRIEDGDTNLADGILRSLLSGKYNHSTQKQWGSNNNFNSDNGPTSYPSGTQGNSPNLQGINSNPINNEETNMRNYLLYILGYGSRESIGSNFNQGSYPNGQYGGKAGSFGGIPNVPYNQNFGGNGNSPNNLNGPWFPSNQPPYGQNYPNVPNTFGPNQNQVPPNNGINATPQTNIPINGNQQQGYSDSGKQENASNISGQKPSENPSTGSPNSNNPGVSGPTSTYPTDYFVPNGDSNNAPPVNSYPSQIYPNPAPPGQIPVNSGPTSQVFPNSGPSGQVFPNSGPSGQVFPNSGPSGQVFPNSGPSGQVFPNSGPFGQGFTGNNSPGQGYPSFPNGANPSVSTPGTSNGNQNNVVGYRDNKLPSTSGGDVPNINIDVLKDMIMGTPRNNYLGGFNPQGNGNNFSPNNIAPGWNNSPSGLPENGISSTNPYYLFMLSMQMKNSSNMSANSSGIPNQQPGNFYPTESLPNGTLPPQFSGPQYPPGGTQPQFGGQQYPPGQFNPQPSGSAPSYGWQTPQFCEFIYPPESTMPQYGGQQYPPGQFNPQPGGSIPSNGGLNPQFGQPQYQPGGTMPSNGGLNPQFGQPQYQPGGTMPQFGGQQYPPGQFNPQPSGSTPSNGWLNPQFGGFNYPPGSTMPQFGGQQYPPGQFNPQFDGSMPSYNGGPLQYSDKSPQNLFVPQNPFGFPFDNGNQMPPMSQNPFFNALQNPYALQGQFGFQNMFINRDQFSFQTPFGALNPFYPIGNPGGPGANFPNLFPNTGGNHWNKFNQDKRKGSKKTSYKDGGKKPQMPSSVSGISEGSNERLESMTSRPINTSLNDLYRFPNLKINKRGEIDDLASGERFSESKNSITNPFINFESNSQEAESIMMDDSIPFIDIPDTNIQQFGENFKRDLRDESFGEESTDCSEGECNENTAEMVLESGSDLNKKSDQVLTKTFKSRSGLRKNVSLNKRQNEDTASRESLENVSAQINRLQSALSAIYDMVMDRLRDEEQYDSLQSDPNFSDQTASMETLNDGLNIAPAETSGFMKETIANDQEKAPIVKASESATNKKPTQPIAPKAPIASNSPAAPKAPIVPKAQIAPKASIAPNSPAANAPEITTPEKTPQAQRIMPNQASGIATKPINSPSAMKETPKLSEISNTLPAPDNTLNSAQKTKPNDNDESENSIENDMFEKTLSQIDDDLERIENEKNNNMDVTAKNRAILDKLKSSMNSINRVVNKINEKISAKNPDEPDSDMGPKSNTRLAQPASGSASTLGSRPSSDNGKPSRSSSSVDSNPRTNSSSSDSTSRSASPPSIDDNSRLDSSSSDNTSSRSGSSLPGGSSSSGDTSPPSSLPLATSGTTDPINKNAPRITTPNKDGSFTINSGAQDTMNDLNIGLTLAEPISGTVKSDGDKYLITLGSNLGADPNDSQEDFDENDEENNDPSDVPIFQTSGSIVGSSDKMDDGNSSSNLKSSSNPNDPPGSIIPIATRPSRISSNSGSMSGSGSGSWSGSGSASNPNRPTPDLKNANTRMVMSNTMESRKKRSLNYGRHRGHRGHRVTRGRRATSF
ncbi:hypothetical protein AYI69_g3695 [Smittium culicis]|uniref:Uncharacterized protein n=1 Tax=Smittium culicis TaxID=133412 RepID=A0A1R1YIZ2_9FUNG|nr:hypothetical protein AYI69_g3695 [Smittium culicis]